MFPLPFEGERIVTQSIVGPLTHRGVWRFALDRSDAGITNQWFNRNLPEKIRLPGADYLVDRAAWDKNHPGNPPQLKGQLFHLIDSPNRFGLDPFYTLHVWAWKDNPNGAFTNWNPNVSCDAFTAPDQR